MKVIHKLALVNTKAVEAWLPKSVKFLHVGMQDFPTVWYETDMQDLVRWEVTAVWTCEAPPENATYLGTAVGSLVWHLYARTIPNTVEDANFPKLSQ